MPITNVRREIASAGTALCALLWSTLKDLFSTRSPRSRSHFKMVRLRLTRKMQQWDSSLITMKRQSIQWGYYCGKLNSIENSMRATRSEDVLYSLSYEHKPRGGAVVSAVYASKQYRNDLFHFIFIIQYTLTKCADAVGILWTSPGH